MNGQRIVEIDNVNFGEALRYLGYGNNKPDEQTEKMLSKCAKELKANMEGKFIYKVFPIADGMVEGTNFELKGNSIKKHLENCEKAVFMCATLSGGVDSLIRKKQIVSMAEAMVTDSLASAVIEQVCDKAEEIILKDFKEYEHTWRFGLGLELQGQFLDILDAPKRIGVCVNSSMMLTPTKSVTCVIGLGHNLKVSSKKNCDFCNFKDKCQFRKQGTTCS
jgi:uncharacterized protein (DUF1778 family)